MQTNTRLHSRSIDISGLPKTCFNWKKYCENSNQKDRRRLLQFLSMLLSLPPDGSGVDANTKLQAVKKVLAWKTDRITEERESSDDETLNHEPSKPNDVPLDLSLKSITKHDRFPTSKKVNSTGPIDGGVFHKAKLRKSGPNVSPVVKPETQEFRVIRPVIKESLGSRFTKCSSTVKAAPSLIPSLKPASKQDWLPIRKSSLRCKWYIKPDENWHSVNKVLNRGAEDSLLRGNTGPISSSTSPLKFPWVKSGNPLNHIFLQESPDAAAKPSEESNNKETETSSVSEESSSSKESPASSFSGENNFESNIKLSYSQTSKVETSKRILAPSKLGSQSSKSSLTTVEEEPSEATTVLKPATFGTSRPGRSPFSLPIVTVSSSPSEPKPAFKLKPSVLGGSSLSATSSFSAKNESSRAFGAKDNVDTPSATTKHSSSDSGEPEPKRLCRPEWTPKSPPLNVVPSPTHSPPSPEPSSVSHESGEDKKKVSNDDDCVETVPLTATESDIQSSPSSIPAFVPLTTESFTQEEGGAKVNGVSTTSSPLSSSLGSGGFIFGQNLSNRIMGVASNASVGATNGEVVTPELNLFTEAATSILPSSNNVGDGGKTLSESSREFSEKEESLKRKYEEVAVVTGEENEKNVIQMTCKLYNWVNACWQERGRGILRLNDREVRDELHSRLVIRTQGTLTVMLNAKIWAEMSIEKSNDKSVRFTATGSDGLPKIYLVMGSPKDITLLNNSLEYRVAAARSQSIDEKERKEEIDA